METVILANVTLGNLILGALVLLIIGVCIGGAIIYKVSCKLVASRDNSLSFK